MLVLKKKCSQTRTFSDTPFNMWGIKFLVHGQEKGLPQCSCIFPLFKYVVRIFLRVIHSTSHFVTDTHVLIIVLDKYLLINNSVL